MHQGTTQLEVLREVILPVKAYHRLSLHAIFCVRLQRHIDFRTCVDNALVQDGHLASRVVHRIVGAFCQRHAASRHDDRAARHIVGTQGDDVGRRAFVQTRHHKLILLRILFGHGLCRVIELAEDILLCLLSTEATFPQLVTQVVAERLGRGQEHAAVLHRIAFHEVEIAIGVWLVVIVQAVTAQEFDQRRSFHALVREIGQIDARRITLVFDVETELGLLHRRGQIIDVLHHQPPVVLRGVAGGVTQRLDVEGL